MFYDLSVQVSRCEYYQGDPSWNHHDIVYPFDTVYLVLGGDGQLLTQHGQTALVPGRAYHIPANLPFDCWCESRIEKVYIEATIDLLPGFGVFAQDAKVRSMPVGRDHILALIRNYDGDLPGQLMLNSFLLHMAAELLPEGWSPPDRQKLRLSPVLQDVKLHAAQNPSAAEVARRNGWNSSALSRAMHRELGLTLKQTIDQTRMNRLKQELLLTTKTLRTLAEEYRFSDSYSLSTFFKRHEGVSPHVYRTAHRRP